jgi:hypothetical protein
MFDFLQQPKGKLVDASKLGVESFELDQSDSFEKEVQWLLVHLYYLCLKYLSNLSKSWWIDSKPRMKGPVEAWTEKFVRSWARFLSYTLILLTAISDFEFHNTRFPPQRD